jgi:hypothetical protein
MSHIYTNTLSLAAEIHAKRFDGKGMARSASYQSGVMAKLMKITGEAGDPFNPYDVGTAEADAWFAGVAAGHLIHEAHLLELRVGKEGA